MGICEKAHMKKTTAHCFPLVRRNDVDAIEQSNEMNISTHNSIVYWCQVVYETTPWVVIIVHLVFYLFCIQKSVGALSRTLKCKWGVQCNDKLGGGSKYDRFQISTLLSVHRWLNNEIQKIQWMILIFKRHYMWGVIDLYIYL